VYDEEKRLTLNESLKRQLKNGKVFGYSYIMNPRKFTWKANLENFTEPINPLKFTVLINQLDEKIKFE